MSVIATALKHLIAAGVSGDDLVRAVAEIEAALPAPVDRVAEKRRAYDRERKRVEAEAKRNSGGIPVESAESAETPPFPAPPMNNILTPPPIPPDITTRAREANPFPKPDWADPQHWRDLKANRKAKRLPNTATAHAKLLRDLEKLSDDEWPPGRLLEAIVARGWAAAYDPRENHNVRPLRPADPNGSIRGSRPDPALDMLYQAQRELQAEAEREDTGSDWTARLALPSH